MSQYSARSARCKRLSSTRALSSFVELMSSSPWRSGDAAIAKIARSNLGYATQGRMRVLNAW
eukprot:5462025-Prymnesium_polylepis.1